MLGQAIHAVIHHHFNPAIGLHNEVLNHDFSRPKEHETKCQPGHSVETLWMIAEEALRTNNTPLWDICAERVHRHLDVGWDPVFGGCRRA